jgi:hypothetical protein
MPKAMSAAEKEMRENVRRGAKLLDKHYPGWAEQVNGAAIDGIFEMQDPRVCVLGTLELVQRVGFAPRVQFNGVQITTWLDADAFNYGFNLSDEIDDVLRDECKSPWTTFRNYWIEQAKARVNV